MRGRRAKRNPATTRLLAPPAPHDSLSWARCPCPAVGAPTAQESFVPHAQTIPTPGLATFNQVIDHAIDRNILSWVEGSILKVLRSFLDSHGAFPRLSNIAARLAKLRGSPRGCSVRVIRHHLSRLEARLGVAIRRPETLRSRSKRGAPLPVGVLPSAQQTTNLYDLQVVVELLQRQLARELVQPSLPKSEVAAPIAAPIAALKRSSRDLQETRRSNLDPSKNNNPSVVVQGGDETSTDSDREVLETASGWGLPAWMLRECRDRVIQAVRYVRHRLELHAEDPDVVAKIDSEGAYLRSMVEDETRDLSLVVPREILRRRRKRQLLGGTSFAMARLAMHVEEEPNVEEQLEEAEREGNLLAAAVIEGNLGHRDEEQGSPQEAVRHYERAAELYRTGGLPDREARMLGLAAGALAVAGRLEEGRARYTMALEAMSKLTHRESRRVLLEQLASVARRLGDRAARRACLEELEVLVRHDVVYRSHVQRLLEELR